MNALTLQILVLKGSVLPDVFQPLDDNMLAGAEIPVPAGAHLSGNILKVFLFRLHPIGHPFIGVVIAAQLVLFKYVGPLPVQRLSQMHQEHIQRIIRSLLQQGHPKALVDDNLQILNAPHITVPLMGLHGWDAFSHPFNQFL